MKFIVNLFKRIIEIKEPPRPLGRWNIEYCTYKIDQKIDLSNEDHCGPCGQYRMLKKSERVFLENKSLTP